MMRILYSLLLLLGFYSCNTSSNIPSAKQAVETVDYVIAFGSCNRQSLENTLWKPILANEPDSWIWGGDVIYADTDDTTKMKADYQLVLQNTDYQKLESQTKIFATWDDHDYGLNDGGEEFHAKKASQKQFLDFLGLSLKDPRRSREGVYHSDILQTEKGSIKVIVLDTRYFRTALTPAEDSNKRYQANPYGQGTLLGEDQWVWFERELNKEKSDFTIIVSSIQVLSSEHGFESWGNFTHERDRLFRMIENSSARGIVILSGDRHISEFSMMQIEGQQAPLIDFTSSGMTHVYESYSGEENAYRIGEVVHTKSFGLLAFNFSKKKITMTIRDENNTALQKLIQHY